MTFNQYLSKENISTKQAAKMLGVSGQAVWQWKTGRRYPRLAQINKITEWSGGQVTANDFQLTIPE